MAPARWDDMCDPVLTRDPGVAVGDRDRHADLLIRRALASIHARDRHLLRCPAVRPHWPAPKAMTRPQTASGTFGRLTGCAGATGRCGASCDDGNAPYTVRPVVTRPTAPSSMTTRRTRPSGPGTRSALMRPASDPR